MESRTVTVSGRFTVLHLNYLRLPRFANRCEDARSSPLDATMPPETLLLRYRNCVLWEAMSADACRNVGCTLEVRSSVDAY